MCQALTDRSSDQLVQGDVHDQHTAAENRTYEELMIIIITACDDHMTRLDIRECSPILLLVYLLLVFTVCEHAVSSGRWSVQGTTAHKVGRLLCWDWSTRAVVGKQLQIPPKITTSSLPLDTGLHSVATKSALLIELTIP